MDVMGGYEVRITDNQQLQTGIEKEWNDIPQAVVNNWTTLCKGDVSHCRRQIVITPDSHLSSKAWQFSATVFVETKLQISDSPCFVTSPNHTIKINSHAV